MCFALRVSWVTPSRLSQELRVPDVRDIKSPLLPLAKQVAMPLVAQLVADTFNNPSFAKKKNKIINVIYIVEF